MGAGSDSARTFCASGAPWCPTAVRLLYGRDYPSLATWLQAYSRKDRATSLLVGHDVRHGHRASGGFCRTP
jgi:hypothetical protein